MLMVCPSDLRVLSLQLAAGTFVNSYSLQPSGRDLPKVRGVGGGNLLVLGAWELQCFITYYIVLSPVPALTNQPWKPGASDRLKWGPATKVPSLVSRQERLQGSFHPGLPGDQP